MLIATNIPPIAEWDFLLAGEALATPLSVWVERSCAVLARHRLLTVERVIAWGSTRVERGRATSEGMAALLGAVEADLGARRGRSGPSVVAPSSRRTGASTWAPT